MPPQGVSMPRQIPPKVHIHGRSPNVTADSRGTVIEALCERYKLPPVVVSQEVYRGWAGYGYTEQIFCGDCLRELTD